MDTPLQREVKLMLEKANKQYRPGERQTKEFINIVKRLLCEFYLRRRNKMRMPQNQQADQFLEILRQNENDFIRRMPNHKHFFSHSQKETYRDETLWQDFLPKKKNSKGKSTRNGRKTKKDKIIKMNGEDVYDLPQGMIRGGFHGGKK